MPHIHDKIDFTVGVFIVNDSKVLLRLHDKYNKWLAVGGHIELDEDPVQAARREVLEETGLTVALKGEADLPIQIGDYRELLAPHSMNRHRINDGHEHIDLVYFAASESREINPAPEEKNCECHWFSAEDLNGSQYEISEDIKRYALAALQSYRS